MAIQTQQYARAVARNTDMLATPEKKRLMDALSSDTTSTSSNNNVSRLQPPEPPVPEEDDERSDPGFAQI